MIRTAAELNAALDKCSGGETIVADGPIVDFWAVKRRFAKPVTIKARFVLPDQPNLATTANAIEVYDSSGLSFVESEFEGVIRADGTRLGRGFLFQNCDNITLERSRSGKGWQGGIFFQSRDVEINRTDFDDVGPFGLQIGGDCHGFSLLENAFTGFNINQEAGEHADALMIYTAPNWGPGSEWAQKGCTGFTVARNLVVGNADNKPQGIFIRDAGGGGAIGFPFKDIAIDDNDVLACMWRAISWESTENIRVRNNRVGLLLGGRTPPGGDVTQSWIIGDKPATELIGNSASAYVVAEKVVADPGVRAVQAITPAALAATIAAWRSRFRGSSPVPAPTPTPAPAPVDPLKTERALLVAYLAESEPIRDKMTAAITEAKARVKAIDKLLAKKR